MADTKISAETAAGALTGAEIVPVVRSTGSPAAYSNLRTTTQAIADLGGGGGGLFGPALSAVPTQASTGLSTWLNQGSAAVSDTSAGILLTVPAESNADRLRGIYKTAPATPYTVTALIGGVYFGNPVLSGIGWTDGTKIQEIDLRNTGTFQIWVSSWTNSNAFAADNATGIPMLGNPAWFRLSDDGTTVLFQISADGINFYTRYSVAKASGFLGASGYSNILFVGNIKNGMTGNALCTLMSYAQG